MQPQQADLNINAQDNVVDIHVVRPHRERRQPAYLQDYVQNISILDDENAEDIPEDIEEDQPYDEDVDVFHADEDDNAVRRSARLQERQNQAAFNYP